MSQLAIAEEVSIKVHCIVSCLCEVIREKSRIDYRPFYIGLWDAPFDVTDRGEVTYYQHDLDHSHYYEWYEKLFGPPVQVWYDFEKSPEANWETLVELVEEGKDGRFVIAQIDMSLMPERENKFHQKPFPHFLILEKTERADEWHMIDADFRWRGMVDKEKVRHAFVNNTFGGGFVVDAGQLKEAAPEAVKDYFAHVFKWENELTERLGLLLGEMARGENGMDISMMASAVKQLPVLAIRKYSYEHALMYFIEQSGESDESFESYCDLVEEVVKGFHNVQYMGMKMAMTGDAKLLPSLLSKLGEMNETETKIKRELYHLYTAWEAAR
ncbi:DUF6005 family protein [Paenibacillus sp. GCM10027627]|uniref:DUF6005 family protein n=1 Tax=unclassified Paenibacillus TaxID=185978 RepID=UPI003634BFC4